MVHPDWGWPKGPATEVTANRAPSRARSPTYPAKDHPSEVIYLEEDHHEEGYLEKHHPEEELVLFGIRQTLLSKEVQKPPTEPVTMWTTENRTPATECEIIPCEVCLDCSPATCRNWVTRKLRINTLEKGHPEKSQPRENH